MMKRVFKRWLAMMLAVLMVMGTLPTTAWAARRTEGEVSAEPTQEENDPTGSTAGRGDTEIPITPVDPDPKPGELSAAIDQVVATQKVVTDFSGTIASGFGTGQDPVAVLIVPYFNLKPNVDAAADIFKGFDAGEFRGYFNNKESDTTEQLKEFAGMPFMWRKSDTATFGVDQYTRGSVSIDWNGQYRDKNGTHEVNTVLQRSGTVPFNMDALGEWATVNTFYMPNSTETIDPEDGLPFMVFISGSSGFSQDTFKIQVTTQPLKVEIEDPQVHVLESVNGMGFLTDAQTEEGRYTFVKVTNRSGSEMHNVQVTLCRGAITMKEDSTVPANWSTTPISGTTDAYIDEEAGPIKLSDAYSFQDDEGNPLQTYHIGTMEPGEVVRLPIVVPLLGPGNELYDALMEGEDDYGELLPMLLASGLIGTLYGIGNGITDAWGNYTARASGESGGNTYPASANGGIHWATNLNVVPKIILVDSAGDPISSRAGTKINTSLADQGSITHKVKVNNSGSMEDLDWIDADGGYYGFPGEPTRAVRAGSPVYVDGWNTEVTVLDGDTKVPMYVVTVDDAPDGAANNDTNQPVLGSYIWDAYNNSRVQYAYYPVKSHVGVYALDKHGAWVDFTGTKKDDLSTIDVPEQLPRMSTENNSSLTTGIGYGSYTVKNCSFESLSWDTDIIANYSLVTINFVTTLGGNAVTNSGLWNTENVYNLRITGNKLTASKVPSYEYDTTSSDYVLKNDLTLQVNGMNPWSVTVPGNCVYTVTINGQIAGTIDTNSELEPLEGTTDIHCVFELGGVQTQIVNGSETATMHVPHDLRPDARPGVTVSSGTATIPSTEPTGGWPVFYYPVGTVLVPEGAKVATETLQSLTYNGAGNTYDTTEEDTEWSVDEGVQVEVASGTSNPLVVTFGATNGTAQVNIFLNDDHSKTPVTDKVQISLKADKTGLIDLDEETTNANAGVYSKKVPEGNYYVYVNGDLVDATNTLDVKAGQTKEKDVKYYTVTVNSTDDSVSTTGGSGTYLEGTEVTITAQAATYYNPNTVDWNPKTDSATPGTATVSSQTASAKITVNHESEYTPSFERLKATIPVKLYLNNTNQYPTGYTAGTLVVTVKKGDGTLVDTWNSASATEFNHDFEVEQGYTYKVYLGTAGTGVGEELVKDYTTALSGNQTAIDIRFYELTVKVGTAAQGNLDTNAQVGQNLGTVSSTSNTASTVVYRDGKTVNIKAVSSNPGNYGFVKWLKTDNSTHSTNAEATVTMNAQTELAAIFNKPFYDTYLKVELDGTPQTSSTVGSGKDITAAPTIGSYTVSWDNDKGAWTAKLPSTDETTKWSVSTIGPKTFPADNAGDGGTTTLKLFSIVATVKSGQSSYGTATPATKTIYKEGTSASISATATNSDWEFDTWTVTKPTSGVTLNDPATTASNTVTMNQETGVEASFKKKLGTVEVIVTKDGQAVNDATVTLTGKTNLTSGTNGKYTFSNVESNKNDTTSYEVTVSKSGFVGTFRKTDVKVDGTGTTTITVAYYTLTIDVEKYTDNNYYGAVKQDADPISDNTYTATTPPGVAYLSGTKVYIAARNTDDRFAFKEWKMETGGKEPASTSNASTTIESLDKTTTLHARFGKDFYDTFLDVTVNGKAHTDSTDTSKITSVKLFNKATGAEITDPSVSYVAGEVNHWTARNVPDGIDAEWWITTVDGAVYKQSAPKDDVATETLFGIHIEPGAGNDATNKPTLKAKETATSTETPTATDYIVTRRGLTIDVALHPINAGYSFKSPYLAGNATNPTADIIMSGTGQQASTATATQFVLYTGYNAPANNADLYIKPQYTFKVTIRTLYNSNSTDPEGAVVVLDAADDSPVKTWNTFDGSEELTELDPDKTYKITVNGFDSKVTFGKGSANGNVDVTLRKISTKVVSKTGTTDTDPDNNAGTAYVKLNGAVGTGDTKTSVYLPNGATTDATHTVNLKTAEKDNYRKATSTNTGESALWTSTTAGVIADGDKDTDVITLGITGENGITADIQVVAHFVRQWTVKVAKDPTGSSSDVYFGSTGTTTKTIDAGAGYIATFSRATGEMLNGWKFDSGKLYTVDASGNPTSTEITTGNGKEYDKVYYVPAADGQTVTALIGTKPYTVTVKVNLDNEAYEDRTVVLKKSGMPDVTMTETSTKGTFTADVVPDNVNGYEIWVNGLDKATTTAVANTGKKLIFSANDGEKSINAAHPNGNADNLTKTINYYTIKIERSFDDSVGNNNIMANHGATATKLSDEKIMLASTTPQDIIATANNTPSNATLAGPYYKFTEWTVSESTAATVANADTANDTTFTLPAENALEGNTNIKQATPITITANYKRQYKVTVEKANTSDWGSITAKVNAAGSGAAVAGWPTYYYVDAGGSVDVKVSSTSGDLPDGWYFKEWRIKKAGTPASDVGAGKFNTDKDVGWLMADNYKNVFKPDDDTALVLDLWKDATLGGGGWTYDRGTGANTSASYGTLTWTENDAQEPKQITVFKSDGTQYKDPLVKDVDYSVTTTDNNVYTYTFKDEYLNLMPKDTYTVKFDYDLGDSTYDTCVEDLQREQNFKIDISAYRLTEANIKVKDGSATLNVDDTVNHGTAEHTSHEDKRIDPLETLTYKWFYADDKPNPHAFTAQEVTDYNNGNPPASWKWTALDAEHSTTGFTDDANPDDDVYAVVPNYAGKGNDSLKGKYIFAVVTADTTGIGTVVTNYIPVDYDATIILRKDAVADGSTIVHDNYKVYLLPSTENTFDLSKAVEATHADGDANGVYKTRDSGLVVESPIGTKITYSVWVTDVETATASNRHYVKTGLSITPANMNNTNNVVNYYSVKRKDFNTDAYQKTDSDGNPLGETFADADKQIASVTTALNSTVADGMGVFGGLSVTAKANGWSQDYKLDWKTQTGNTSDGTSLTNTATVGQTSANATNNGYTTTVSSKTWIGGDLKQQEYIIRGNIVGSGTVTGAKLTVTVGDQTYTFNGDIGTGQPGTNRISFTVPKAKVTAGALTDFYTIEATVGNGTTLEGYSAPAKATFESKTPMKLEQVDATENGKFAIHIASTALTLELKDDDTHSIERTGALSAATTHTWTEKFANNNGLTQTVTLTNNGNAPLKVNWTLQKSVLQADGTWSGYNDVTIDANNQDTTASGKKITFSNMAAADLVIPVKNPDNANANKATAITITVPDTLENRDDVKYQLVVTSVDARAGQNGVGPTLTYNLDITINPVNVASVSTNKIRDAQGNVIKYEVKETTIEEDDGKTGKPSYDALVNLDDGDDYDRTNNADIVYEWYVAPWNATVTLNKTTGVPEYVTGGTGPLSPGAGDRNTNYNTYEPTEGEKGMALFLVAKGQRNATNAAMTPDVDNNEAVELVPFDSIITITENTTLVDTEAGAAGYVVYLWNTAGGDTIDLNDTNGYLIPTVWDGSGTVKGFKSTKNLWASDPEHPDATKPYTYKVYASIVKGTEDSLKDTIKDTGKTVSVDDRNENVTYYQVIVNETTVNQNDYEGKLNTADTNTFWTKTTLPANLQKPSAAAAGVASTVNVEGKWVQTGTSVTFTYPDWVKDYKLTWDGPVSGDAYAGAASTKTLTYDQYRANVETTLELNLYDVTAHVIGGGVLSEITMTMGAGDTLNVFMMSGTDDLPNHKIKATTHTGNITGGNNVVFKVPAGTMAMLGTEATESTTILGYKVPHDDETLIDDGTQTITVTRANTDMRSYDIMLQGSGQSLNVTDTHTTPHSATATYDGTTGYPGGTSHTITLNYNYDSAVTLPIKVTNTSTALDETGGQHIYNVTANYNSVAGEKKGDGTKSITLTDWTTIPDMAAGEDAAVSLTYTVPKGLPVGTYNYTAVFGFDNDNVGNNTVAITTFKLIVEVKPLPFTAVEAEEDRTALVKTYQIKDYNVKPDGAAEIDHVVPGSTDPTTGEATRTGLAHGDDYSYQWVTTAAGVTSADVTWDSTTGTINIGSSTQKGAAADNTSATYVPADGDQGRNLYLVIYSNKPHGTGNATGMQIYGPITQGFQGIVYIDVDGKPTRGENDANATDGAKGKGYKVNFVNGNNKYEATWTQLTNGDWAYTNSELQPNLTYTVEVSRFKNDTAAPVTLTGASISNTNRETTAPYYTVNPVAFKPVDYHENITGEKFDGTITPDIYMGTEKVNATPVLEGQSVTAKVPNMGGDNAGEGWLQDYTLTWRMKNDDNNATTVTDANLTNTTVKQNSATAVTTGLSGANSITVTKKTFVGGQLIQNTYVVKGTVKNETGMSGGNTPKVELMYTPLETGDTHPFTQFTFTTATQNTTGTTKLLNKDGVNTITDRNNPSYGTIVNNVYGEPGDEISVTVVKGKYMITAYDGNVTTIQRVTIGPDDKVASETDVTKDPDDTLARDKELLDPQVAEADRIFTVYVANAELTLTVADTQTTPVTATSTVPHDQGVGSDKNHHFKDNVKPYYFKTITATNGTFNLTLKNEGNTDLKLLAPEVYQLDPGTVHGNPGNPDQLITSLLTNTNKLSISGNGCSVTDVFTLSGLPAAGTDLRKNTAASAAGTLVVSPNAEDNADKIYVIKFSSEASDNNGNDNITGPTVYYVLDLTVNPLPIKQVDAISKNGTLQLATLDTGAGVSGLDSVWVDDGKSTTGFVGAETAGLDDTDDIAFLWFSAPADMPEKDVKDLIGWNAANTGIESKDTTRVKMGVNTNTGKTYSPAAQEQGLNFYLVAYRKGGPSSTTSNAAEFAVSDAVYAQVKVGLKAYRTGETNDDNVLTDVQIHGVLGETKKDSNDDEFTVTSKDDNVINFNADMNDYMKNNPTATDDDPDQATWYFHHWAVRPYNGAEIGSTDPSVTTPVGGERLDMNYAVSGKSTVVGYYDLLPTLRDYDDQNTDLGFNSTPSKDDPNARTMTYTVNDGTGQGRVRVVITPPADKAFKNTTDREIVLGWNEFDSVAGDTDTNTRGDKIGKSGKYVLNRQFIVDTLELAVEYSITFYDLDKGSKKEGGGGYEGYDRTVTIMVSGGEVNVKAQAEDIDTEQEGRQTNGKVRITSGATVDKTKDPVLEGTAETVNNRVAIQAIPDPGYKFAGWKNASPDPTAIGTIGNANAEETTFRALVEGCVVEASFVAAPFEVTPGKAKVYYGNIEFEKGQDADGNEQLIQINSSSGTSSVDYTYTLLTEKALEAYLTKKGETRKDNYFTMDGITKTVTDDEGVTTTTTINKIPDWLDWNEITDANGKKQLEFSVKAGYEAKDVHVQKKGNQDVEDELVVFVSVTTQAGAEEIVPFTVDIMTSKLKIVTDRTTNSRTQGKDEEDAEGAEYKSKYLSKYGSDGTDPTDTKVDGDKTTGKIIHGGAVEMDLFEFMHVVSIPNPNDKVIADAATGSVNTPVATVPNVGTWKVVPPTFDGSGPNDENENEKGYTFTFTYTGTASDEDNFDYEGDEITMRLPVQKPNRTLLIGDTVANADAVVPGTLTNDETTDYSLVEKPEGYDGSSGKTPEAMAYTTNTFRKNETITYLDDEPEYTVSFKRIGDVRNITLTLDETDQAVVGFKKPTQAAMDAVVAALSQTGDEQTGTITLELDAVDTANKVWVGEHYIRFKLSGKDEYDQDIDSAYYTLVLHVKPKVITSIDVKTDGGKVDVTGTTEDGNPVNDDDLDGKLNIPIKPGTTVEETKGHDGKVIERKTTVEINPNYIYVAPTDPENDPLEKDIVNNTKLDDKDNTDPNLDVKRDGDKPDHIVHITQNIPWLMFHDVQDSSGTTGTPKQTYQNSTSQRAGENTLGTYTVYLGGYGADVYDVEIVDITGEDGTAEANQLWPNGVKLIKVEDDTELAYGEDLVAGNPDTIASLTKDTPVARYILDLSGLPTQAAGRFTIKLKATGTTATGSDDRELPAPATYTFTVTITNPSSPPPPPPPCPCKVLYHVGAYGTTVDATIEDVKEGTYPSKVPTVAPLDGYIFLGWSLTDPATVKDGKIPEVVDPKTVDPWKNNSKGEDVVFYAVIMERPYHEHYVIGYPNGNFGPADNINRASVATIIARAILPGFVEGANYGNPGKYSDVSGHWAESAIAYCSKFNVFTGYDDGTFKPNQPITRQEFALVIARLDGVMTPGEIPFDDIDEAGNWAVGGIYTAYAKGWVNGYPDGTFKPLSNIRRDEAVKVFNAYLNRGVDADGLYKLHEYVHSGVASNNTENGTDEYMTWPDVPKDHWAYYEIVEAANDHEYAVDFGAEPNYTVPETWDKCWIDERWRYHDDINDGGPNAAMVSAGFRVWLH